MKWLRSDGVHEYICFRKLSRFRKHGIMHEITATYSPESNGRAEWPRRVLLGLARTLTVNLSAPQGDRYWGAAVNCANYLRYQKLIDICTGDVTPFESGHDKRLNHSNA